MMKRSMILLVGVIAVMQMAGVATASLTLIDPTIAPYTTGAPDWLADVRLRNFNSTFSDYEMMVNASPTRIVGQNQTNGHLPIGGARADWAENNTFYITYDPLLNAGAGWVSLRLVGSGTQLNNATGGYDITIGHAPDAVTAGPVNYIEFQLWDRVNFPTFNNGLTITDLNGTNLGNFSLAAAGIDSWAIIDETGSGPPKLNGGFVLQGDFTLDLTKVAEGREGDKIMFFIAYHPSVPTSSQGVGEVPESGSLALLGLGLIGVMRRRRA